MRLEFGNDVGIRQHLEHRSRKPGIRAQFKRAASMTFDSTHRPTRFWSAYSTGSRQPLGITKKLIGDVLKPLWYGLPRSGHSSSTMATPFRGATPYRSPTPCHLRVGTARDLPPIGVRESESLSGRVVRLPIPAASAP